MSSRRMGTKEETQSVEVIDGKSGEALTVKGQEAGDEIVTTMTDEAFRALLHEQGWTMQHVVVLAAPDEVAGKPGGSIAGRYIGPGAAIEMAPDRNGEIKSLTTWRLYPMKADGKSEDTRVVVTLVGSYNINRAFATLSPGDFIGIRHKGKVNRPGQSRQLNDYFIFTRSAAQMAQAQASAAEVASAK